MKPKSVTSRTHSYAMLCYDRALVGNSFGRLRSLNNGAHTASAKLTHSLW